MSSTNSLLLPHTDMALDTYDWWIHNANETRPADVFFAQEGHPPRGDTEYERIVAVVDVFNAVTPVEKQMLVLWAQQHRSRGTPLIWFVVLPWYAF